MGSRTVVQNEANMSTRTRRADVSDVKRLGSGIKLASDEVKAGSDARTVAIPSSERDKDIARGLTLDDFGGRSDALGG
jgi:hypothetical protein